jgi:hypothetical protein
LPTVEWMHFSTGGANVLEEVPAGAGAVEFFSFLTSSFFAAPLVGMKWGGDAAQGRRFFFNAEEEGADTSCFTSVNGGAAEDASVGVHLRGQFTPPPPPSLGPSSGGYCSKGIEGGCNEFK